MTHSLARLVQHTRGELSTVRPVLPAVTAPDPGAAAWDEQIATREAAPLAAPQVPRVDARPRSPAILVRPAPPPDPGAVHPPATAVALPAAPDPAPEELREPSVAAARSAEPAIGATAPLAAQRVLPAEPPAAPAAPWHGAPAALPALSTSRSAPRLPRVDAAHGVQVKSASPSIAVRAGGARTIAATDPELDAPSGSPVAERAARGSAAAAPPMLARPPRSIARTPGPSVPAVRADAMTQRPAAGAGSARHAAPAGPVQDTATRVEVSIGRIEVRLPPRPQASGGAPPAPRRPVVGLAEYLRARDTGKTP